METVEGIIKKFCNLQSRVAREAVGYAEPNDGFCCECGQRPIAGDFQNSGTAFAFIEAAVNEKIERDVRAAQPAMDAIAGIRAVVDGNIPPIGAVAAAQKIAGILQQCGLW